MSCNKVDPSAREELSALYCPSPPLEKPWRSKVIDRPERITLVEPGGGRRGWICPRCGKVWAPWIPECMECNKEDSQC